MTPQQLEAIYKLNLELSHSSALRAVYTQGYSAGAAIAPSVLAPDITPTLTVPAQVVRFRRGGTTVL